MKTKAIKKVVTSVLTMALAFTLIVAHSHINAANSDTEALKLDKTAVWNKDGTATIKLESYATGKVISSVTSAPTDIVLVLDVSGSMSEKIGGIKKIDALKTAANSFIKKTNEKNQSITDDNLKHRISIVKYAGDKKSSIGNDVDRYNDNYTQIVKKLTTVNNTTSTTLQSSIKNLKASGATSADYGLEHAQTVLKDSSQDRKKVVIMFTDGEPNHSSGFSKSVARDAINIAKEIKKESTLYTISVMKNANPDDLKDRQNKYMNAVSSNYPYASATIKDYVLYTELAVDFGTGENKGFYKKATNASELENVFDDISNDVGSSGVNLDKTAVLKDYISDYFQVPDKSKVIAYTENYNGAGNAWTKNNDQGQYKTTIDQSQKTVNVTGFDYSTNYVLDKDPQTGKPVGKKLVVEITVLPIDGFIGGNKIDTNKLESGIYNQDNIVKKFPSPHVDVPIQYMPMTNDATIYVGDDWKNVDEFIKDLDENKVQYKINNKEYHIDGLRNAYVDITYTILDNKSNEVGKYTISAKETTGKLDIGQIDTTMLHECQDFKVKVNVKPIYNGYTETYNTQQQATLHILKPSVLLTDTEVFYGESTNLDERVSVAEWQCGHKEIPSPVTAPQITYKFIPQSLNGTITEKNLFTPEAIQNTDLSIIIENHGRNITQYATFHNSDKKENINLFTVKVIAGTITIQKRLSNINQVDLSDGDPIFIFKIVGNSVFGEKTYYRYVRYSQLDELSQTKSALIKDLPAGDYTVEELSTLRFTFESVQFNKQNINNENGKIQFTVNKENQMNTVDYKNKTKSNDYFSDNDVLINKFVKEDNQVIIKQDKLDK